WQKAIYSAGGSEMKRWPLQLRSLGQSASRKQTMGGHSMVDSSRGLLHWAQSISFVAISMDHTLQPVLPADSSSPGE
ncbi:mediator of RNA polymerase II transcription subunit, partial [Trifolium medium]|nr:mediator of RNA polymerase II transcription subunit [Trifolium medium]